MGQHAARITAADFVTPPEFKHLQLANEETGRIGGVRLTLSAKDNRTRLDSCYQQVSVRAMSLNLESTLPELVYLINPTAGLLDGDGHLVHINAGPGTHALVVGQSANRIHPAIRSFCTQQWHVTIQPEGMLVILPGPTIPFRASRCYNSATVDLHDGAHLIWGEVWLPGRHGESFSFDKLIQEFVVRRGGLLNYRNRFCWQGPWNKDVANWHFAGAQACGSLFITKSLPSQKIRNDADARMAIFETAAKDTVITWYGPADAVVRNVVQTAEAASNYLHGADRQSIAWSNHLTKNHWFMPFDKN